MALSAIAKRPSDASFTGGTAQGDYAAYIKAFANEYLMRYSGVTINSNGVAVPDWPYSKKDAVTFSSTGSLPPGTTAGTTYYAGDDGHRFRIATSQANVDNGIWVSTSGAQSGVHSISWPASHRTEENSILNFVPRSGATKVFCPRLGGNNQDSGLWSLSTNWFPNGVPATNDKVLIGPGVTCIYDIASTTADLYWIRVDGTFKFEKTASRQLIVDTLVTTNTGTFECGRETDPVADTVTINVEYSAARGWLDVAADTMKQSRGYVFMGQAEDGGYTHARGAEKTHALRVADYLGPLKGATTATLENAPQGWKVGDRIVFSSTKNHGIESAGIDTFDNLRLGEGNWFFDEDVVTITNVSGNTVSFTPALQFNHNTWLSEWSDQQPKCWVENLSRNIKMSTKNWASVPVEQRAHGMMMHTGDCYFAWVEHREMGRTVKDHASGFATGSATANVPMGLNGYKTAGGVASFPCEGLIDYSLLTPSSYPCTITTVGTDGAGNTQTDVTVLTGREQIANEQRTVKDLNLSSTGPYSMNPAVTHGSEVWARIGWSGKFFKTVISITSDKAITRVNDITWRGIAFRPTGQGARLTNSGDSSQWTFTPITAHINLQTRYPCHIHRAGVSDVQRLKNPHFIGIVVDGAPGWGIVHHDSWLILDRCISHDTHGTGIVGETGSEAGVWRDCHASAVRGGQEPAQKGSWGYYLWGDPWSGSNAFGWAGRTIKGDGLVGHSCECAAGFIKREADGHTTPFATDHPETLFGIPYQSVDRPHIQMMRNSEFFACNFGLKVEKSQNAQGHDVRTVFEDILVWSARRGLATAYTAHYTMIRCTYMRGFMISLGTDGSDLQFGFSTEGTTTDWVLIRPRVDGMWRGTNNQAPLSTAPNVTYGIEVGHSDAGGDNYDPRNLRVVVDPDLRNCTNLYRDLQAFDKILSSSSYLTVAPDLSSFDISSWYPSLKYVNVISGSALLDSNNNGLIGFRTTNKAFGTVARYDRIGGGVLPQGSHTSNYGDYSVLDMGADGGLADHRVMYGTQQDEVTGDWFTFFDMLHSDRVDGEIYRYVYPARLSSITWQGNWFPTYAKGPPCRVSNLTKPVATDRTVTCVSGQTVDINMIAGASHPNGRIIMARGCTQPRYGTVVRQGFGPNSNGSNTYTYISPKGFVGTTDFKFWVMDQDGNLQSARGNTITVNVTATDQQVPGLKLGYATIVGRGYINAGTTMSYQRTATLTGSGTLNATGIKLTGAFYGISDYAENLVLNFLLRATGSPPASLYIALHTGDTGENGTTNEVSTSGTNYARQAVTFAAPSGGTIASNSTATFGVASSLWGTVTNFSIWDASSGGNCIATGLFAGTRTVNINDQVSLASGGITITAD